MRRASTHTSHTQSHFPHIPLRPTEPKPLTQNYIRVFALPSELQHLSKLEVFETSTRHPCIFNELIFFYKDKIIILNYQIFFVFFFVEVEGLEPSCRILQLLRTTRLGQYFLILRNLLSCSSPSLDNHQWTIRFKIQW